MSRRLFVVFGTVLALGSMLGVGLSCSEYFFAAYPDIEVRACPLNGCPASVDPSLPPGAEEPTNASFADPGLTKDLGSPRTEKLTLRIYNAGEGQLTVTAPSVHDISLGSDSCVFGMEAPGGNDYDPGEVCPKGSSACTCDDGSGNAGNCDPNRAAGVNAWIHLQAGGYAEYTMTYYYTAMHSGCERTLELNNTDPDTLDLVGETDKENPWVVNLVGSPACEIEITPAAYNFGSGVTGSTKGTTLEMRLSDHCEQVRLVGMRIVDAAGVDPQAEQRGGLGSLCVGPNDGTGEPEPQNNTCATNNCLQGGAGVARCVDSCAADTDCGNNMQCQDTGGGSKVCWPLAPYDAAGRGGGSDIAVLHYGTRADKDGQPSFPKYLASHADNDPDGWITTTFTCTEPPSPRAARVEVLFDLDDGRPRAAYGDLSGTCGACPLAMIEVTDPPDIDDIGPLDTVTLDGSGSTSTSGKTIRYNWYFSRAPSDSHTGYKPESNPGAANTLESHSTSAQPTFFVDLAGVYKSCLEICELNDDGTVNACTSDMECQNDACVEIDATPRESIHVQLVWDHPETDVDLHYIHAGATYGDREIDRPDGDCHFFNPHPDYCVAGDDTDDPSLDIDDVRGYGPENINHDEPCDGEYRIWASYYEDKGMGSTRAKVRVFIKGVMASESSHILDRRNCHWLVGKVIWSGENGTFEEATEGNYVCGQNNPEG